MGESGLITVVVNGNNENTKSMEGKFSIGQSSRKVTTLEAGGPQKSFIGKEVKEWTDFPHMPEAT